MSKTINTRLWSYSTEEEHTITGESDGYGVPLKRAGGSRAVLREPFENLAHFMSFYSDLYTNLVLLNTNTYFLHRNVVAITFVISADFILKS